GLTAAASRAKPTGLRFTGSLTALSALLCCIPGGLTAAASRAKPTGLRFTGSLTALSALLC
ncbi:hypothetical protein, partial [uncultured Bifidobacterium sp.]|uniref:hypothetical protein n=1 Tax=uncultured Bifidobacterium sp. TaxID=165187 RepID=UPI00280B2AA0